MMSTVLRLISYSSDSPRSITRTERAHAASWAAQQTASSNGSWWVETHLCEDGDVWLGVVTPSSLGRLPHNRTLSWLVSRQRHGIELCSMPSGKTVGISRTVAEALAAIVQAEAPSRSANTAF